MSILSPYIIAVISAWLVSQGLKYVLNSIKTRSFKDSFRQLYLSGSMPSAHSASVVALLVLVGHRDGVGSGLFALVALFSAIVMYDAMMVRRSSGEQGKAIIEVIKLGKLNVKSPRVAKGHTPVEVLAGSVVGLVVGIVVTFTTI